MSSPIVPLPARERAGANGSAAAVPPPWRRRHLLDVEDFARWEIERVLDAAEAAERLGAEAPPLLLGQVVATVFYEPSTRTRASFELAARRLGAEVVHLSAQESSVAKGESLLDTLLTLEAMGAEVLVVRHPEAGVPETVVGQLRGARLVNAGDGWRGHPTQALLDLFTLRRRFGRLRGLRVAIVGDIVHSRVARSNLWAMTTMGLEVVLCGPPELLPAPDNRWRARVEPELEQAIRDVDVVMALRLQKERHATPVQVREYVERYQLNAERLRHAPRHALVMHPGPVNVGIELSAEVVYGPRSLIAEQVRNGVYVRTAVLGLLARGAFPQ